MTAPASTDTSAQTTPSSTTDPKPQDPPAGAPEKYADFTVPEGVELNADAIKAASDVFRSLNLSQEQAQSLVNFHTEQMKLASEAGEKVMLEMRNDWRTKVGSDPDIGRVVNGTPEMHPKLSEAFGRMYAHLETEKGGVELVTNLKEALDLTGAGDHPGFLKFFYKIASRFNEARPLTNGGGINPAPTGQVNPAAAPRSMASAMFPNLPSGQS